MTKPAPGDIIITVKVHRTGRVGMASYATMFVPLSTIPLERQRAAFDVAAEELAARTAKSLGLAELAPQARDELARLRAAKDGQ